jgi:hypothetical protein
MGVKDEPACETGVTGEYRNGESSDNGTRFSVNIAILILFTSSDAFALEHAVCTQCMFNDSQLSDDN